MGRVRKPTVAPKSSQLSATWRVRSALFLILAWAAFLRLHQITTVPPALHFDEAMNGNDALENLETGHFSVFYPQNGGRESLYINIETVLIYFLGNEAWVLRILAAVFGILTVWGVYCLGAELFSVPIGLLSSFLIATSFWHVNFSRIGLRAIGAPLFAVWALYFLLHALQRVRERRPYAAMMAVAGLLYGLGFHTYIAYRATPPLIALVMLYWWWRARSVPWQASLWKSYAIFTAVAVMTVAPLFFYFVRHPEMFLHRSQEISIFNRPRPWIELSWNIWQTILMIFTRGDLDWLHNISGRPMVFWPVAILFAVGLGLGCRELSRRTGSWFSYSLVMLWLLLAAVPAVLTTENMPHALRSILMIPPIFILAGAAGWFAYSRLTEKVRSPWLSAAPVLVLLALAYEPYHRYFTVWAKNFNVAAAFNSSGAAIANRINGLPSSVSKYVVVVFPGVAGGMPAPGQTVMFLTRSYTRKQQQESNIHYITRESATQPDGVDFCRSVAASLSEGELFCLQVTRGQTSY